jgi:nicotinamidase-related amidase
MLDSSNVSLAESALLVVDVQDSFKVGPRWEKRNNRSFETNVGDLITAYRSAKRPVIFFLHSDADDGFSPNSPHYKLMDFITPRAGELVIHKTTRNCFTSTCLQALFLEQGIRRVAITGIQMEQCCETTARVAADLGYAVDFVIDGTLTFPIPNWDEPGKELGVEAVEERTAYALRRRFARVVKAADLAREVAAIA